MNRYELQAGAALKAKDTYVYSERDADRIAYLILQSETDRETQKEALRHIFFRIRK